MQPTPDRRTIRLPAYEYTESNAYFVTLCAHEKRCIFGEINGGTKRLNRYGTSWYRLNVFPAAYFDLWTSAIVHQTHRRVFEHMDRLAKD